MYPRRNSAEDPELQRALAASLNNQLALDDDFDGAYQDDFAYDEDAALARAMEESQRAAALSADVARQGSGLPAWARPTQYSPPRAAPAAPWRTTPVVEPWRQSFMGRSGSPPRTPSPHAIQDGVARRTPTNTATIPLPEPRVAPLPESRPASIPVDGSRRVLVEPSLPSASQLIRNQNDEYQRAVEADLRARIQAEVEKSQRMAAEAEAARRAAEEAQLEIRRAQEIQAAKDAIQGPSLLPVDSLVDSSEVYSLTFIYPDGSRVPYSINRREPLASLFQLARYTLKHAGNIQLLIPGVARLVERAGDEVDRRPLVEFATIGPRTLIRVLPQ